MRKSLSILLALTFFLLSCTACASTQKATSAASGEMPQAMKQHGSGEMPQGERPSGEKSSDSQRAAGDQKKVKDSGAAALNDNSTDKTITGKVKSIVGNEVVLIVTQASGIADKNTNKEKLTSASVNSSENASKVDTADIASQEVTETYLIPVGMAIGNKDFSAIKAGNTLKIYFGTDPTDSSEIITTVELR